MIFSMVKLEPLEFQCSTCARKVARDGFQVDISCSVNVLHLGGEVGRNV